MILTSCSPALDLLTSSLISLSIPVDPMLSKNPKKGLQRYTIFKKFGSLPTEESLVARVNLQEDVMAAY